MPIPKHARTFTWLSFFHVLSVVAIICYHHRHCGGGCCWWLIIQTWAQSTWKVRINALKQWTGSCTSRRSCVVIGHKNQAQRDTATNVLKPLHSSYRALQMVTLDTSFWQLKLEEGLMASRNKGGGADVLCLTRADVPGGNSSFGGFFLQSLDAGSAKVFLKACLDHSSPVSLKASPKIKARPSKPKKVTPKPRSPSPRPPKPVPSPQRKAKGSVDQVGSRETLESEEPLFEAVDEEEEEEEEEGEEDEVELWVLLKRKESCCFRGNVARIFILLMIWMHMHTTHILCLPYHSSKQHGYPPCGFIVGTWQDSYRIPHRRTGAVALWRCGAATLGKKSRAGMGLLRSGVGLCRPHVPHCTGTVLAKD